MNTLKDMFDDVMNREGRIIEVNQKQEEVFFRMNGENSTSSDSYLEVYSQIGTSLQTGDTFEVNGVKHLIIRRYTPENEIYQKFMAVRLNQHIKYMLDKDLVEFDLWQSELADKINGGDVITLGSNAEFKLPLNDLTKKIKVNDRFFCGSFHAVWRIREMDYKDNIVTIYCERDIITEHDDVKNGIADRFPIEPPPEPQPVGEIKVEPPYDKSDRYSLLYTYTQTFRATLDGVVNPQWEILLDSQGIPDSNYVSTIDNNSGIFTVENKKTTKGKLLKYIIKEKGSNKSLEYLVELSSLF